MKKMLSLILATVLIAISIIGLSSCGAKTDGTIKVTTLNGTTGFGMAPLMHENSIEITKNKYELQNYFDEYIVWGGMPQRFKMTGEEQTRVYLSDIYNSIYFP